MWHLIERLLGWRCCGEWTQWEKHEATYEREPSLTESSDMLAYFESRKIRYSQRWQERRCTMCGKIQQQDLKQ